jgi:hypothetical protein
MQRPVGAELVSELGNVVLGHDGTSLIFFVDIGIGEITRRELDQHECENRYRNQCRERVQQSVKG